MRFIVDDTQTALEAVTYDDTLYQLRQNGSIPDTLFLCKPERFVYLLKMSSVNYIDTEYIESVGYPVYRAGTLQGGKYSALVVGSMWYLISAVALRPGGSDLEHVLTYGPNLWKYVLDSAGLATEVRGIDLEVEGTARSVCRTAVAENPREGFFMNSFLSETTPPDIDRDRAFLVEDSPTRSHSGRVSSLEAETGNRLDKDWLVSKVEEYFSSIGILLERGSFTDEERDFAKHLEPKHQSEEWVKYASVRPDFL